MTIVLTVLMGSLGACLRFFISQLPLWNRKQGFPYATLLINVLGSALLGMLWGLYNQQLIGTLIWQWFGIGLLGAFTTFSTFSYEGIQLIEQKRYTAAILYVLATIILGVLAAIGAWLIIDFISKA